MPSFSYEALDSTGKKTTGLIDAPTKKFAVQNIRDLGLKPTKIEQLGGDKKPIKTPHYVTLEPCEANTDGTSVTVYFVAREARFDVTELADVEAWALQASPTEGVGNLWFYTDDDLNPLEVIRTQLQPFPGFTRYQIHPTG